MSYNPPKQLGPFIWSGLRPYWPWVLAFVTLSLCSGLWSPLNSLLLKDLIDAVEHAAADKRTIGEATFLPSLLLLLNFEAHNLCWRGMAMLNRRFEPMIKSNIIRTLFDYVHSQTHVFFQDRFSGRIASQITILADNIQQILHDISRHLFRSVMLLPMTFAMLYRVHAYFAVALLVWFILFTILGLRFSKRLVTLSEAHAETETALSGQLVDSITNASTVRFFAMRQMEVAFIDTFLNKTKRAFQIKEGFEISMHYLQGLSITILLGLMLYVLTRLSRIHHITAGDFALVVSLTLEVGFIVWWTLEQVDALNKALGRCQQSFRYLFVPIEIQDAPNAGQLVVSKGEIVFSSVQFHYKGHEPLFQNKSIRIEAGQKVGLVGYSGSGKTTFVNLILRLYEVTGGRILIDDQDIRAVTQDSLHSSIGMIPQEPLLFHRSLMENIRCALPSASDEAVMMAAQKAYAHDFIMGLPQGYQTLVGERGIKLSGGQRQRVTIARILLKNPPILILDEATSQLDSMTENQIQASLWNLMRIQSAGHVPKTTLVIAHRLSTLLNLDRILVFEKGKIIEDGTHSDLLAQRGLYATLWSTQVGGFLRES